MTAIGRPSDDALWASVAATLQDAVLPAIADPHRRQVVIQLVGLAAYAGGRGPDPAPARVDEVAGILGGAVEADRSPAGVMQAAANVLCAAVDAGGDAAADLLATRDRLRATLLRHLDEDLATEQVLLDAFRGRLPGG